MFRQGAMKKRPGTATGPAGMESRERPRDAIATYMGDVGLAPILTAWDLHIIFT